MEFSLPDFKQLGLLAEGLVSGVDQTGILFVVGLFSLLCVFFSGCCLLLYFRANGHLQEVRQNLHVLDTKVLFLEKSRQGQKKNQEPRLQATELKSRLEKNEFKNRRVPEKYSHVAQLERSGLGIQEVAEILEVSHNEAEQMLALVRSSRDS